MGIVFLIGGSVHAGGPVNVEIRIRQLTEFSLKNDDSIEDITPPTAVLRQLEGGNRLYYARTEPEENLAYEVIFKGSFTAGDIENNVDSIPEGQWEVCIPELDVVALNPPTKIKNYDETFESCQTIDVGSRTSNATFTINDAEYLAEPEKQCEGLVIGWIVCPMIQTAYDGINWMFENLFVPLLSFDPLQADDGDATTTTSTEALFNVWNSMRIIANVLFVLIFLIAIFGQTFSFFLTPYEMKKILPRLVLGIIIIQLSWFLVGTLVDIFNVLGAGLRSLILVPVNGTAKFELSIDGILGDERIVGLLLGKGVLGAFRLAAGIKGLLWIAPIVLVGIVMFLLLAFLVVLLRVIVIVLLAVSSPLAFAAWTLPNTEGLFKFWWNTLIKLLVMYPLIIALIAIGELSAKLIIAGDNTTTQWQIVALIALFAPFFLIPQTFNFAGGIIGNIAGNWATYREKVSNALFGEARDQGSYRAAMRRNRVRYQTQRNISRRGDYNAMRGMGINPLNWRKNYGRGFKNNADQHKRFGSLRKAGRFGRALTRYPSGYLHSRTSPTWFGTEDSRRNAWAKDVIGGNIGAYGGGEDFIHALFGDKNIFTGEQLSRSAINSAKKFRGDNAILQQGMTWLMRNHTSYIAQQQLQNKIHGMDLPDHFMHGVYKGIGYATQTKLRDLKHRGWNTDKSESYIARWLSEDDTMRGIVASRLGVSEDALDITSGGYDQNAIKAAVDQHELTGRIRDDKLYEFVREIGAIEAQTQQYDYSAGSWLGAQEMSQRVREILETNGQGGVMSVDGSGNMEFFNDEAAARAAGATNIVGVEKLADPGLFQREQGELQIQTTVDQLAATRAGLLDSLARGRSADEDEGLDPAVMALGRQRHTAWREGEIENAYNDWFAQQNGGALPATPPTPTQLGAFKQQQIDKIISESKAFLSPEAHTQILKFIRSTEWVNDENTLRSLNTKSGGKLGAVGRYLR